MLRNAFGSREIGLVGPELEGRQEVLMLDRQNTVVQVFLKPPRSTGPTGKHPPLCSAVHNMHLNLRGDK